MNRLQVYYENYIREQLIRKCVVKNSHHIPEIEKILLHSICSKVIDKQDLIYEILCSLEIIGDLRPSVVLSKKSVNQWKLRKGYPLGGKLWLRSYSIYWFLDKVLLLGLSSQKEFDGLPYLGVNSKEYSFGLTDMRMFMELDGQYEKFNEKVGLDIFILSKDSCVGFLVLLLSGIGFPFYRNN